MLSTVEQFCHFLGALGRCRPFKVVDSCTISVILQVANTSKVANLGQSSQPWAVADNLGQFGANLTGKLPTLGQLAAFGHWGSCQPLASCQPPLGTGTIATGDRIHRAMQTSVVIDVVIEIVIEFVIESSDSNTTSDQLSYRANFNP